MNLSKATRLPFVVAVLTIAALWVSGCKDTTIVGGNLIQPSADVQVDTIPMANLSIAKIPAYSGGLTDFSSGIYQDKLFGTITATGIIQPTLAGVGTLDTLTDDSKLTLRLAIHSVYGDTTSTESFDLVEASQPWRGREWIVSSTPPASNIIVGSFSVGRINSLSADSLGDVDSVNVPISQNWVKKYREAYYNSTNRDSSYIFNMPGFVIVPKSEGKILAFDPNNSHLMVTTPKDTTSFVMRDWAYSVSRTNIPSGVGNELQLYSTLESIPKFDIKVDTSNFVTINGVKIGTKAMSRVQMILHADSTEMKNTLPANNIRPHVSSVDLFYIHANNIQFDILNGALSTAYEIAPGTYSLDLTSRINSILTGSENSGSYYLIPQTHSGTIYSLLIHSPSDTLEAPELIVTSVKPKNQ